MRGFHQILIEKGIHPILVHASSHILVDANDFLHYGSCTRFLPNTNQCRTYSNCGYDLTFLSLYSWTYVILAYILVLFCKLRAPQKTLFITWKNLNIFKYVREKLVSNIEIEKVGL